MLFRSRDNVRCILGDVVTGNFQQVYPSCNDRSNHTDRSTQQDQDAHLSSLLQDGSVDLILANPPFIPVPPKDDRISLRYGMFSSGGPDGLVVVRGILHLAARVLKHGATLAMVSEFGISSDATTATTTISALLCGNEDPLDACKSMTMTGLLCTNEFPVSAETYAARRADSSDEFRVWNDHLEQIGIRAMSPGLLYLLQGGCGTAGIQHCLVPKTEQGSVWTPSNYDAVEFTSRAWSMIVNSAL